MIHTLRDPDDPALTIAIIEAESKAWDSLSRYKFQMFGYWAAIWVHLNKLSGRNEPNPWRNLVKQARELINGEVLSR